MIITCKSCQSRFRLNVKLLNPTGSKVRCTKCRSVFKVLPPVIVNRRKHPRIKTRNLISHVTVDENGEWISQGLSKAVDISKGGILLETPHSIESGLILLMAVDVNDRFFEIKGERVYCKKAATGLYLSGIKFVDTRERVVDFAVKLIKEYNHRKNHLHGSLAL